jgi:hypothetical protein
VHQVIEQAVVGIPKFAVAGLHCAGARDQDMEEVSRCAVHSSWRQPAFAALQRN